MRNFCRRFPLRFQSKPAGALFIAAIVSFVSPALVSQSRAQAAPPPLGGEIKFAFPLESTMPAQGLKYITILRSLPARGKVDVEVQVDQGGAAGPTINVPFRDFQTRADIPFTVDATQAGKTNTFTIANVAVAAGEDPAFTPVIAPGQEEMELQVKTNKPRAFNLSRTEVYVTEGSQVGLSVVLAEAPGAGAEGVAVDWRVSLPVPADAMIGTYPASSADVEVASGTLTFANDETVQTITLNTFNDDLIEFDESFIIELTAARGTAPDPADPMAPRLEYSLGDLTAAKVKILFNGFPGDPDAEPPVPGEPLPPGAVDQLFNPHGVPPLNLTSPGALGPVTAVAVGNNGAHYIAGNFNAVNASTRPGLARLLPDGTVDTAFAPSGLPNGSINAMAVYLAGLNAGKVLIGGGFTAISGLNRSGIARFMPNGAIDTTFNPGQGANGPVYAVALGLDGSIIIGGDFSMYNGAPRGNIARLRPNGSLDPNAFNGTGMDGPVFGIALEQPAPFTIGGAEVATTNEFSIEQMVPGQSGTMRLTYDNFVEGDRYVIRFGNTVVLDEVLTNQFVIITDPNTGTTTTNVTPVTLTLDLGPEANASNLLRIEVNPGNTTNATSFDFTAVIIPASTLGIVAVGDFTTVNGVPHGRVARFNGTGQLDAGFSQRIGLGADGRINAADLQADGKIILGGEFSDFNGIPSRGVARLLANGTFDQTFTVGAGADDAVLAVHVDRAGLSGPAGGIYIGGQFRSFNGTRRISLARLLDNGSLDTGFLDTAYNHFAGFPDWSGYSPFAVISSIATTSEGGPDGGVFVGGIFDAVGGGATRASVVPRQNYARLMGGELPGPGNISFSQPLFGGAENGGSVAILMDRLNGNLGDAQVNVATEDGSAIDGEDYEGINMPIIFPADTADPIVGETNVTTAIVIIDDTIIEGDEEFFLLMGGATGRVLLAGEEIPVGAALGAPIESVGRIIENDRIPAAFSFSAVEYDVDENRTSATIEVRRTGNTTGRVTVQAVATLASAAPNTDPAEPADFTSVTNTLVFAPNITTATFQVPIVNDELVEVTEVVQLFLTNAFTGAILTPGFESAVLNIVDNDLRSGRVDFSSAGYTVNEGGTNAVILVRRRGGSVGTITVDWTTEAGTATPGEDYVESSGRLTWNNADISTKTILIPIIDNDLRESAETFSVLLRNPVPAGVLDVNNPTTVTIQDNDFAGQFLFGAAQFFTDENGVSAVIPVLRRGGSAGEVSVNYAATAGTAVAGTDFQPVSGRLTFAPGVTLQTFVVPILDDTATDPDRTVNLRLSVPVGGATIATGGGTASLVIVDNESLNIPAGSVETDFAAGGGANGPINAILIQNDTTDEERRIIVAGDFTQFNVQNRQRIARLLDDGSLDRRYAQNLLINGAILAMTQFETNKVIIGGAFTRLNETPFNYIARLNNAGQIDLLFNPGSGADNWVYALAETFSGEGDARVSKVVVGGEFITLNGVPRQRIGVLNSDGSIDTTFDPGSGANGTVLAIAVQRDGKILIGGEFTLVDGQPRAHIARLNTDGSLDTTFNPGLAADGAVRSITLQSDDRILIGGNFRTVSDVVSPGIARLNADGTLDPTFNVGAGANGTVYDIEVQPDGNIVVGGEFTQFGSLPRSRITRLLTTGANDTSINFGSGANGYIAAIELQNDRKIVIGGNFTVFDSLPRNRIARLFGGSLSGSGSVEFESGFYSFEESNGTATLVVRRQGGTAGELRVQFDMAPNNATEYEDYIPFSGELVFAPGETIKTITIPLLDDTVTEALEYFTIELTNPTGGALGRQPFSTVEIISDDNLVSFEISDYVASEVAPGGQAIITVIREGEGLTPVTVRYRTIPGTATAGQDYTARTGTLTFDAGETLETFTIPVLDDVTVEGDETVLLVLESPSANATIGRGQATLTIADNDFAPGRLGFATQQIFTNEDGGGVNVTITRTSGRSGAVSVRYQTASGTAMAGEDFVATSGTVQFLQGETTKTIFIPINDDTRVEGNEVFSFVLSNPTGGAILANPSTLEIVIADSDFGAGSLDGDFNVGSGASAPIEAVYVETDGRIVIGGLFQSFDGITRQYVARLTPEGPVDLNFDPGVGPDNIVNDVAPADRFGSVLIGGAFRSVASQDRLYVARLTPNGSLDPTMNRSAGLNGEVISIAMQDDGNAVLGGLFTTPAVGVTRITRDGSLDVSFNVGSGATQVYKVALGENGRVFVGGAFSSFSGIPRSGVVALRGNGSVDTAFVPPALQNAVITELQAVEGGKVLVGGSFDFNAGGQVYRNLIRLNADGSVDTTFQPVQIDQGVHALAVQPDGKILIGGNFMFVNNEPRMRIARLNPDGTLDTTFDPGQGANDWVLDMFLEPDGQVVVVGEFTTMNGFPRRHIARINGDEVTPQEPIQITSITREASDLVITFTSQAGVDYELQGTTDFVTWTPVRPVATQGTTTTVRIPLPEAAGYQFFRVRRTTP